MARKSSKRTKKRRIITPQNAVCPFCENKTLPDYKNSEELLKYITERARILGKARSGVCSKHQRVLSREIKRARHLGLLPFAPSL